jgi:hypothetical protein
MSTIWDHRTNKGRVVYDRKPHLWTDKDVERIVKAVVEDNGSDVLMMSEIADRLLFWLASKLGLAEAARFAAQVVVRLFDTARGMTYRNGARVTDFREQKALIALEIEDAAPPVVEVYDRASALRQLKVECQSMIDWIDQEIPSNE